MKNLILFCLLSLVVTSSFAQSPYENRMLSGERQRVGLVAFANESQLEQLRTLASKAESQSSVLKDKGMFKLSIFFRPLNAKTMVFAYFETPSKQITGWEQALQTATPELTQLSKQLIPHDRAVAGTSWLKMEWINLVASEQVFPFDSAKSQKMGLMSGLKPADELQYRFLHQANWPGVVDGMVNSNYRNWTTFLVEDKEELYLFTFTEYIGDDISQDNKKMAADPTTQRWWQHTERCLINLHGEGNWSLMK